ncbi:hypothetical protein SDC9_47047 [bioreactor metagenome]|uniref:Uncharacterized protein n=1 Tax=bioreactor metagenome TaxID=1076179 RepID=A0A644WAH6_9ZZZZ
MPGAGRSAAVALRLRAEARGRADPAAVAGRRDIGHAFGDDGSGRAQPVEPGGAVTGCRLHHHAVGGEDVDGCGFGVNGRDRDQGDGRGRSRAGNQIEDGHYLPRAVTR